MVAPLIDHTLLRPEATAADVAVLCAEAERLGVAAVCVSPSRLPVVVRAPLVVATVIGFPSGAHRAEVQAEVAERALSAGATEPDLVPHSLPGLPGEWA